MARNFFAELNSKMQQTSVSAGVKKGPQIFGESYELVGEPKPLRGIPDSAGNERKITCACVLGRDGVSPTGRPFHTKFIRVFITNAQGKPSKAYAEYRMNPDSPLTENTWLDLDSLVEVTLMHLGKVADGFYADGKPGNEPAKEILDAIMPEDAPAAPAK